MDMPVTTGASARADYSAGQRMDDIGALQSVTFTVSGNDGVNIGEFVVTYKGVTYRWIGNQWISRTSPRSSPRRLTLLVSNAYTQVPSGPTQTFHLTAVTSDRRHAGTNSRSEIIIYGSNGWVGPLSLGGRNTFQQHSNVTRDLSIPDIGNFIEMKIINKGNDAWHINQVSQTWKGVSHRWTNNAWLDGNGGYSAPHAEIWSVNDMDAAHACGTASLFIAHSRHAQTNNDIFVSLTGTLNSSRETLISTDTSRRGEYSIDIGCALGGSDLGTLSNATFRLAGNDGVQILEFVVVYQGSTYRWLGPLWLDGNSGNGPQWVGLVSNAYPQATGPANTVYNLTTVTGNARWAATSHGQQITLYGTNGYVGPMWLSARGQRINRRDTTDFSLSIPDIGNFLEMKLKNTGNDGWQIRTLTGTYKSWSGRWVFNRYLDGDGGYSSPHANIWMAADSTCQVPGYSGGLCDTALPCVASNDPAAVAPNFLCQNGLIGGVTGSCTCSDCSPGFTGRNCGTNIDNCASNPCQNNATCTDGVDDYACNCRPGWSGKNCSLPINTSPCAAGTDNCDRRAVCVHNGTSTDPNSHTCVCNAGYETTNFGVNCTQINDCRPNPCQAPGARCTDRTNGFRCRCRSGYSGSTCQNMRWSAEIYISHKRFAETSNSLYVTLNGPLGTQRQRIATRGRSRQDYTIRKTTRHVGALQSVTFEVSGNDGVNLAEMATTYAGVTYRWTGDYWLGFDSYAGVPTSRFLTLNVSSAYTRVTRGPNIDFNVTAVTSDASNANTNSRTEILIFGTNGYFGPVTLGSRNTFPRHSTVTRTLRIKDIGDFIEMKITNTGNDGWSIHQMSQSWKGVTHQWTTDQWLDGNGNINAPHAKVFSVNDLDAAHPCATATIMISHDQYSNSNGDIFVYVTGSLGSSRSTLISTNTNLRKDYTVNIGCPLGGSNLGTFQNATFRLVGNDGVKVLEYVVNYANQTYRWVGDSWLDGDSVNNPPQRTLTAATAYMPVTGSSTRLVIKSVTSDEIYSNMRGRITVILYGSNGYVGPLTLGTRFDRRRTYTKVFNIGNIGNFVEMKVKNEGNDGWRFDYIQTTYSGWSGRWDYNAWLDGNGGYQGPHAEMFEASRSSCALPGFSGGLCNVAEPCVASRRRQDRGANGNFYCVNDGTVGGVTGSCTCTGCRAGFAGSNCATNVNDCASNPCRNGGSCVDLENAYACNCRNGYTGNRCQTAAPCSPAPSGNCGNSSLMTCAGTACNCAHGYQRSGNLCTVIDNCASNPCMNGGTCSTRLLGHSCSCPRRISGANCDIVQWSINAFVSHKRWAQTRDSVYGRLTGSTGNSSRILIRAGMGSRADYLVRSTTVDVGVLQSITLDVSGLDAVNFAELRVVYKGVTYAWIDTPAQSLWMDGPRVAGHMSPLGPQYLTLTVASAYRRVTQGRTTFSFTAVTSDGAVSSNAGTNGETMITIYGTNGFHGPVRLAGRNYWRGGMTRTRSLRIPDIGNLVEFKVAVVGEDGWHVNAVSSVYKGVTHQWTNNAWLDGDGGTTANPTPHAEIFSVNDMDARHPCGTVELFIDHRRNANTGGNVWATLTGSSGSSRRTLVSNGVLTREVYTMSIGCSINNTDLGAFQNVEVSLSGNDGVVIGEIMAIYNGTTYRWLNNNWLNRNTRSLTFTAAAALPKTTGRGTRVAVTAVTSDFGSAATGSTQNIILFGSNGYAGPMRLARSFARAERKTVNLRIGNIGTLQEVRIINTGNDAWHVQQLSVDIGTPSTQYLWAQNADATRMYRVTDSDHRHGCGTMELYVSHERNADSRATLYATFIGVNGTSPETVITRGVGKRNTYSAAIGCRVNQTDLGVLRSVRVRSNNNNDAYLSELSATYKGTTYRWYDAQPRFVTLDANSNSRSCRYASGPSRRRCRTATLPVADAKLQATSGPRVPFTVKAVTSDRSWANTDSTQQVIVYGSAGFVGPVTLAPRRTFVRHSTKTRTLQIRGIGTFMKMKVLNSGGDGWHLNMISATYNNSGTSQWTYNNWLDGDTSTVSRRSYLWSMSDSNRRVPCGSAEIFITHRRNAQTGANLYATLIGSSRSSSKTLITDGVQRRGQYAIDVGCVSGRTNLGTLRSVKFETNSNDGVNIGEFAATYRGQSYRWVDGGGWSSDSRGGGRGGIWLDRNSRPRVPSVTKTIATASPRLTGAGTRNITIRAVSANGRWSGSGSRHTVIIFGSNGHVGPLTLTQRHGRNSDRNYVLPIPDIGNFLEMKVENQGNDGWQLNTISTQWSTSTYRWNYNRYLDGNGGYTSPHADVFTSDQTCTSSTGNCAGITCGSFKSSTACSADTIIFTKSMCQRAATMMGLGTVNVAGSEWASGCLIHNGAAYYSPHADGSNQTATDFYICDSQTKHQETSGHFSMNMCPAAGRINSLGACVNATRSALSSSSASVAVAGSEWASGCLFHNGNAYFSAHATNSTQNPTDAYICTQCAA
jgi:hypothetical protein